MKQQIAVFFLADNRILQRKEQGIIRHCTLFYVPNTFNTGTFGATVFYVTIQYICATAKPPRTRCLFFFFWSVRSSSNDGHKSDEAATKGRAWDFSFQDIINVTTRL